MSTRKRAEQGRATAEALAQTVATLLETHDFERPTETTPYRFVVRTEKLGRRAIVVLRDVDQVTRSFLLEVKHITPTGGIHG